MIVSSATAPEPAADSSTSSPRFSTAYASAIPVANSSVDATMKVIVYLRSFFFRPGVMNAQIWYSQIGAVSTAPAMNDTLSRVVKPSRTPV